MSDSVFIGVVGFVYKFLEYEVWNNGVGFDRFMDEGLMGLGDGGWWG